MCEPITGRRRRALAPVVLGVLLAAALAGRACPGGAAEEPKPDPAGVATGDRTSVYDAGGTAFVVAEPTDRTAADYGDKKRAFDEYQAQAEKEPLAAKLADGLGHLRVATNVAWTL